MSFIPSNPEQSNPTRLTWKSIRYNNTFIRIASLAPRHPLHKIIGPGSSPEMQPRDISSAFNVSVVGLSHIG